MNPLDWRRKYSTLSMLHTTERHWRPSSLSGYLQDYLLFLQLTRLFVFTCEQPPAFTTSAISLPRILSYWLCCHIVVTATSHSDNAALTLSNWAFEVTRNRGFTFGSSLAGKRGFWVCLCHSLSNVHWIYFLNSPHFILILIDLTCWIQNILIIL